MTNKHAVLGESLELCREAEKWFAAEKERLEKSQKASKEVMDRIRPMVERNRNTLIKEQKDKNPF